jgi:hypothetical protein
VEVMMVSLLVVSFVASLAGPQSVPPIVTVPPAGQAQEIVLQDGSRILGRVEGVTDDLVTFRTTADQVIGVERSDIAAITVVVGAGADDRGWPIDLHTTRMMFMPTARALKRGESYFGLSEISVPFVQVGITDRISIGGGTSPIPVGGKAHPFWLTPKVEVFAGQKTQAAVGMIHFTSLGYGAVGIAYGVVTHGTAESAATVGVGYAYARGFDNDGGAPVVLVGGERRVGGKVKLLTENYLFRGGGMISGGIRIFGKRRAVDLGLMAPVGAGRVYPLPIVTFMRRF